MVDRPHPEAANWEVIIPSACDFGCREIMDEVVDQFLQRYDLLPEEAA